MKITGLPQYIKSQIGKDLCEMNGRLGLNIPHSRYCPLIIRQNIDNPKIAEMLEDGCGFALNLSHLTRILPNVFSNFGGRTQKVRICGYHGRHGQLSQGEKPDFLEYFNFNIFGENDYFISEIDDQFSELQSLRKRKSSIQTPKMPRDVKDFKRFLDNFFKITENGPENTKIINLTERMDIPLCKTEETIADLEDLFLKNEGEMLETMGKKLDDTIKVIKNKDYSDEFAEAQEMAAKEAHENIWKIIQKNNSFDKRTSQRLKKKSITLTERYNNLDSLEDVDETIEDIGEILDGHNIKQYFRALAKETVEDLKVAAARKKYGISIIPDDEILDKMMDLKMTATENLERREELQRCYSGQYGDLITDSEFMGDTILKQLEKLNAEMQRRLKAAK